MYRVSSSSAYGGVALFHTLAEAKELAQHMFEKYGIIVGIERVEK